MKTFLFVVESISPIVHIKTAIKKKGIVCINTNITNPKRQKATEEKKEEQQITPWPWIKDHKQFEWEEVSFIDGLEVKKTTWIEQVDIELDKQRKEKEKEIQETFDSFNITKWQFEKNKWFYKNFDETNTIFDWVLKELRDKQRKI